MAATSSPKTAFISGHTDLSQAEFDRVYVPLITTALANGHSFLLGDARGVDTQALEYLLSDDVTESYPSIRQRITIYASRGHNITRLESLGVANVVGPRDARLTPTPDIAMWIGVENEGRDQARYRHLVRDTCMTRDSDYDILYVRNEQESRDLYGERYRVRVSATEHNRRRREKMKPQNMV